MLYAILRHGKERESGHSVRMSLCGFHYVYPSKSPEAWKVVLAQREKVSSGGAAMAMVLDVVCRRLRDNKHGLSCRRGFGLSSKHSHHNPGVLLFLDDSWDIGNCLGGSEALVSPTLPIVSHFLT